MLLHLPPALRRGALCLNPSLASPYHSRCYSLAAGHPLLGLFIFTRFTYTKSLFAPPLPCISFLRTVSAHTCKWGLAGVPVRQCAYQGHAAPGAPHQVCQAECVSVRLPCLRMLQHGSPHIISKQGPVGVASSGNHALRVPGCVCLSCSVSAQLCMQPDTSSCVTAAPLYHLRGPHLCMHFYSTFASWSPLVSHNLEHTLIQITAFENTLLTASPFAFLTRASC